MNDPPPFDGYWDAVVAKNPPLESSARMTITIASFKAQMRQAFEAGQERERSAKPLFEQIFGKPRGRP